MLPACEATDSAASAPYMRYSFAMAKSVIDEYIAKQDTSVQKALRTVRKVISKAIPAAEETISYGMPAYKLHGKVVVFFAGWKEHFALYPAGANLTPAFGAELARYEMSKGTIRFPLDEPVPEDLITRIVIYRAEQVAAAAAAKRPKTKRAAAK